MFLHLSVILFTEGGVHRGSLSRVFLLREVSVEGVSVQGGLCQVEPPYNKEQVERILLEYILVFFH